MYSCVCPKCKMYTSVANFSVCNLVRLAVARSARTNNVPQETKWKASVAPPVHPPPPPVVLWGVKLLHILKQQHLCGFLYLTCFVLLRKLLGESRLMWCLRSLKHSAVSISSNWSFPPSPSLLFVTLTVFCCCFFLCSDIPRIPDSTHAQLESSKSSQNSFLILFYPVNQPET